MDLLYAVDIIFLILLVVAVWMVIDNFTFIYNFEWVPGIIYVRLDYLPTVMGLVMVAVILVYFGSRYSAPPMLVPGNIRWELSN
ncbi:Hypothetical protein POVN_LOCUS244 [uncultured virus]|nr:Hypothetical protein POVN_LOCUS244 [uncultured virus]